MRDIVRRFAVAAAVLLAGPAAAQDNVLVEDALFVTVPTPITSEAVESIRNRVEKARNRDERPVRKVVFDFNPDGKDAATADFGPAFSLASYVGGLHDVTTVGFVHAKASAHTVLPVLACKEVAMSRDARLGPVAADGVTPVRDGGPVAVAYRDALGDGRANRRAAVRKLYDPAVSLGKGLKNGVPWFVDLNRPDEAKADGVANARPVAYGAAGQAASYDQAAALDVGFCTVRAEDRKELAELYQISPASFRDPLQNRAPVPFHYVLKGDVDGGMRESVGRLVKDVRRRKGNLLFLELQCAGGDLDAARALADDLRKEQTGDDAVMVVAYVPDRAPDAATFISLGCSEIVMSKRRDALDPNRPDEHKEAELGDFEAFLGKGGKAAGNADLYRRSLQELAVQQGYPGLLADAFFDRSLEVVQVRSTADRTRRRLMTRAEWEADQANWQLVKNVKGKNQFLKLNATLAAELGVARGTVENRDVREVYASYGVRPGEVREAEPGWLDRFADFLKRPEVTVILVLVGFMGLMLELKVPGLTVPGITAALCFILVFWAQSRFSGETFVLALLLFMMGIVLVALEIFVLPGFGAPGVVGILCMLAGLALVTVDKVPQSGAEWGELGSKMGQYLLAMAGALALVASLAKYLPNIPGANRLLLALPVDGTDAGAERLPGFEQAASLLGAIGTTNTALRPAGVVRFADAFVDVVSEGGYVPAGVRVQVVEVEGARIVVREV